MAFENIVQMIKKKKKKKNIYLVLLQKQQVPVVFNEPVLVDLWNVCWALILCSTTDNGGVTFILKGTMSLSSLGEEQMHAYTSTHTTTTNYFAHATYVGHDLNKSCCCIIEPSTSCAVQF